MIACKDDESPYALFSEFVFEFIEMLKLGSIDAAEAMIDEVNPVYEGELRDRFEISGENDGEFMRADMNDMFDLTFYKPGRDLGNDYTVEFSIPNDTMLLETALEFRKVEGGYVVVLVRL